MKRVIRVGTRESALAMAQSKWVINEIKKKFPRYEFELVGIRTSGDMLLDVRLDKIGGKGLFIKELENALINKSIDIAVHSMKDLPAQLPEELTIAAISRREDPRDALISIKHERLEQLEPGAVIGTSSLRREIQLLQMKPGLNFKTLRGNVLTRLDKLAGNEFDAIVLAVAGLKRLGIEDKCRQVFSVEEIIPAVGQGALGIETRRDEDIGYLLESVHHEESALAVKGERAYMIKLNGGCSTPVAAHAVIEKDRMKICGIFAPEDKSRVWRATVEGNKYDAAALGEKLAALITEGRGE